jgi:hypothetical protein
MLDLMLDKGFKMVTLGECLGDAKKNWYRAAAPTARVSTASVFTPAACASTTSATSSGAVATPTGALQHITCGPNVELTYIGRTIPVHSVREIPY